MIDGNGDRRRLDPHRMGRHPQILDRSGNRGMKWYAQALLHFADDRPFGHHIAFFHRRGAWCADMLAEDDLEFIRYRHPLDGQGSSLSLRFRWVDTAFGKSQ